MRVLLMVRGLVGLFLGIWLATALDVGWDDFFSIFADYLVVDGVLAVTVGIALLRESSRRRGRREAWLGVAVLVDGAGRVIAGIAVHIWPGIPGFPVTAVLFLAIMATGTATVGILEALLTAREELAQHGLHHERPQFMAGAVALGSIASTAFGLAAIHFIDAPESMRMLITGYVIVASGVALVMARSRRRMTVAPGVA